MTIRWTLICVFVSMVLSAAAQAPAEQEVILYDPLFWKDQLSLKNSQSRRIQQINHEFYQDLRLIARSSDEKSSLHGQLTQSLIERSHKIWETLYPKQRRKLEKIMDKSFISLKV